MNAVQDSGSTSVSLAIGNTHTIEIKKNWQEKAILYIAIVGRAGTNKSHPLSFALSPIELRDKLNFQKFEHEQQKYNSAQTESFSKKNKGEKIEIKRPICEQIIVKDFTPEALVSVQKDNNRGNGVFVDELASWFKNFNRYNNGSEEQFWLSTWNHKPIRINRKTSESISISSPFISVIGTIQPSVLYELAEKRADNGFLDRILFVFPDNLKKDYWNDYDLDSNIIENWNNIITKLLNLSMKYDEMLNSIPQVLFFSKKAKQRLFQWQRQFTDLINELQNDSLVSICSKLEIYASRLALCLEMAFFACNESEKKEVDVQAVDGAIKLVKYFQNNAFKISSILTNVSPIDKLSKDWQNLYTNLPDSFATNQGVKIAQGMGIPERSFKNFINNKELFIRSKRGCYDKLL